MQNSEKANKKVRIGEVVSDKMKKTIVVKVLQRSQHPKYNKMVSHFSKFKVHDEKNEAKLGNKVKIIEARPMSKDKRWRLLEILK